MFKADLCDLCGDCLVNCTFNEYTLEEAIAERQTIMDGKWAPILHDCASCRACNERCKQRANPWDLISQLQGVYKEVSKPATAIERIAKVDQARLNLPASPPPEPAETVLSPCSVGELAPSTFDSRLYASLPKLVGPAYYCCTLDYCGDEAGQHARAQGLVDAIAAYHPKEVVCYHDACYLFFSRRMPEYGIELPFRPVHLFEHLLRTLREHQGDIRPLNMKVAYQRPCTSRDTPWTEPILDELLELIGCERVARAYDRDNALCCGSVLALRGLEDRAKDAAARNVRDSLDHGAEALAILCPSCLKNYAELCDEHSLPARHISELCQMALGEVKTA